MYQQHPAHRALIDFSGENPAIGVCVRSSAFAAAPDRNDEREIRVVV
ncbi:hypothetical protein [Nocardia sp. XZ_19_385]|nr:hypothetical protein [Nocardia sp. XZ_19_385]